MDNLAKELIEKHGKSVPWIMLKLSCSHQAVQNWLAETTKPARYFHMHLLRLCKLERARKEKK